MIHSVTPWCKGVSHLDIDFDEFFRLGFKVSYFHFKWNFYMSGKRQVTT